MDFFFKKNALMDFGKNRFLLQCNKHNLKAMSNNTVVKLEIRRFGDAHKSSVTCSHRGKCECMYVIVRLHSTLLCYHMMFN